MNDQKYQKLRDLLKTLFQLDQPDLDFGLYRIMHAKAGEVTKFLDEDLRPQIEEAFAAYQTSDKAELGREIEKASNQARDLGMDPEQSPKVQELTERYNASSVDVAALESEVYDHLYRFFRRYYSDGDFLSKRVYKEGVYAIPYEGEEVMLHWANRDQYYIKTSEYLRDYAFRLRPDSETDPMRVHFRLADVAEGEHGNVKTAEGKDRVFVLAAGDFLAEEDGEQGKELVIRFEYRPATMEDWPESEREDQKKPPKQKDLLEQAAKSILAVKGGAFTKWLAALGETSTTEKDKSRTVLHKHLNRYAARNTFDYFIHKDLGAFLRRELDFFIKNEVMHLDDIESESVPRVEQYLSKIKVIRRIAGKIIDFLAQLEDFQKKLWLKKKFVVESSWCIRLDLIPEDFHKAIAANEGQRAEWDQLGFFEAADDGGLFEGGIKLGKDLTVALSAMVDTRHFDADFTARLLDTLHGLDDLTDGVLFHSENFQALSLMQERYREQVKCIYIDPPYNTGNDGFAYRDNYKHSTWAAAVHGRIDEAHKLLEKQQGCCFISMDDGEQALLRELVSDVFGDQNFVANIIWQKKYAPANDATWLSDDHDFILSYARDKYTWAPGRLSRNAKQNKAYSNPDNDSRGPWKSGDYKCNKSADERPNLYYAITNPNTGKEIWPKRSAVWRYTRELHERNESEGRVWWGVTGTSEVPAYKRFLSNVGDLVPRTIWKYDEVGHTQDGIRQLRDLLPETAFTGPKPFGLIERVARVGKADSVVDFFAGSGTTGHAVINLNREDGGRRKFILVEMGDYFDTVLLPRLKKVAFSPEWKNGKPKRMATAEEAERGPRIFKVVRLESYEDTLNNLETRRTQTQDDLLFSAEAGGEDGFREQYLLQYMLTVETKGSASLLNVAAFADPSSYELRVKRPGSDESRLVRVDLLDSFNWLLGLRVAHIAAPQTVTATMAPDGEGRLRITGRLKEIPKPDDKAESWTFRRVEGTMPDGRKALILWRTLTGVPERDNLMLDHYMTERLKISTKDFEFDLIFVNGDNNLENLKATDDTWKVRLIEEDFKRLMFAAEGV